MSAKISSEILDRLPPSNLDAEKAVLGSLLLVPDLCDEVALILRADDFYSDANQRIYGHMLALHEQGRRLDWTLLEDRLKNDGVYDEIGGRGYIAEIAQAVPTAANAEHYARIVQEKATLRSLIMAGTEILRDAYDTTFDSRSLLNRAEERIFAVHDARWKGDVTKMVDVLHEAFDHIDARLKGDHAGVQTGFTDMDALTGGLHPGELAILAARPSMGKTALATNIADHVAVNDRVCTLFVSLEMSRLELAQRMLCARGKINGNKFRSGFLSGEDRKQLMEAQAELSQGPLFIDDTPTRTITEIAAAARRLKRKSELALIIIDYLQLVEPDNPHDPRQEQVAKMARRLKAMARELRIPVLCLAQLNRQAEVSRDNRPRLSHLRESGAIEQDADVVMFVHREWYYLSKEQRSDPGKQQLQSLAEIHVAKQRNGPTGEVHLHWNQDFTRFDNAANANRYAEFDDFARSGGES